MPGLTGCLSDFSKSTGLQQLLQKGEKSTVCYIVQKDKNFEIIDFVLVTQQSCCIYLKKVIELQLPAALKFNPLIDQDNKAK